MWMFYSKSTNTRINHLHQRACRLIYYYELTFEELSEIDGSFTICHYNFQMPYVELYKLYQNLSEIIFSDLFTRNRNSYNLWPKSVFVILILR